MKDALGFLAVAFLFMGVCVRSYVIGSASGEHVGRDDACRLDCVAREYDAGRFVVDRCVCSVEVP